MPFPSRHFPLSTAFVALSTLSTLPAFSAIAQSAAPVAPPETSTTQASTTEASPLENAPASPEAALSPAEAAPAEVASDPVANSITEVPIVEPVSGENSASVSRLFAPEVSKNGDLIVAQGTADNLVRFETTAGTITALRVQLDTRNQVVEASGSVQLQRQIEVSRRLLVPRGLKKRRATESATETLTGQNLRFDFKTRSGTLDSAQIQLAALFVSAQSLTINRRRYSARDVLVRPGGLSPEETRIYGTPPLNIRAKTLEATLGDAPTDAAGPNASGARTSVVARGGALYFRNTKILPLPAYVFRAGLGGGGQRDSTFQLTPGISFNSADRVLITTRLSTPLSKTPGKLDAFADIGLSQRIGVRGGVGLEAQTGLGALTLRARRADVVETQLTNRIELDRKPELIFDSVPFLAFDLPGQRRAGFTLGLGLGSFGERRIGDAQDTIDATRFNTRLLFTTRLRDTSGPFLRLFASSSRYGSGLPRYGNRGLEIGTSGQLLPRVNGQISLRSTSLSGETPFRFDRVEIARELRTTFDIELSPRFLVPVDLRYDLNRRDLRDASFGILRSYKVFAYGLVYQTARRDLRLEVRQGF